MSLIEGIGDEVTHFFIGVFAIIIVYIAWRSTNISEQRHYRTVLLLDRRRRTARSIIHSRIPRRLSNHTETITISESSSSVIPDLTQNTLASESSDVTSNSPQSSQPEQKPVQASSSSQTQVEGNNSDSSEEEEVQTSNTFDLGDIQELEERDIIETMDADTQNTVRLRRLAHFKNVTASTNEDSVGVNNEQAQERELPHSSTSVENKNSTDIKTKSSLSDKSSDAQGEGDGNVDSSSIIIKLKYINDDVKIVNGRLEEFLGDFKKRHFETELNSNKVVRLIFNGQVLKQDRQSLKSCGLFNNCVVHCLIHQKRPSVGEGQDSQSSNIQNSRLFGDHPFVGVTNLNNNNQGIDWDLGNFLFALISFILLAAWYFRYVYAHLYTVTATVGLLIITGIFSIILIGTYFPDNEQFFNHNTRIRIARPERFEVQRQQ